MIDLNSDKPLAMPDSDIEFDSLLADARASMVSPAGRSKLQANGQRRREDKEGFQAVAEMRAAHRHTYVKLRYVLLQDRTTCRCGVSYLSPQGIFEESQSTKGGATTMVRVVDMPHALPRVIRTVPSATLQCESCAREVLQFHDEVVTAQ